MAATKKGQAPETKAKTAEDYAAYTPQANTVEEPEYVRKVDTTKIPAYIKKLDPDGPAHMRPTPKRDTSVPAYLQVKPRRSVSYPVDIWESNGSGAPWGMPGQVIYIDDPIVMEWIELQLWKTKRISEGEAEGKEIMNIAPLPRARLTEIKREMAGAPEPKQVSAEQLIAAQEDSELTQIDGLADDEQTPVKRIR